MLMNETRDEYRGVVHSCLQMDFSQRWRLVSAFCYIFSVLFTFRPSPKTPIASPECQWSDIQTDRQLDRQLDRQVDRQVDRQADMNPAAEQVGKLLKK
jgi:hypothetical protein